MAGDKKRARASVQVLPFILLSAAILFCGTSTPPGSQSSELHAAGPIAIPSIPARGLYMGVLPIPADDQSLEAAYALAKLGREGADVLLAALRRGGEGQKVEIMERQGE